MHFKNSSKTILSLALLGSLLSYFPVMGQKKINPYHNLIIGTYTNTGKSKGIYVYQFNSLKGTFKFKGEADGIENPSYLTLSANHRFVYAVNETDNGKVSAFSFNPESGSLNLLNAVPTGGANPCYISVDSKNRNVFIANYTGGSLSSIPLNKDGSLGKDIQILMHTGKGVDTARQEKAHVHMALLSPDQTKVLTADLGIDSVNVYTIHYGKSAPLSPYTFRGVKVEPGNGPRHMVFSPSGKFLYLVQEMKATINVYQYQNGALHLIQNIGMETSDFSGKLGAADVHISADGKFLYATNRGDANDIVIYKIGLNGKLFRIGKTSTLGLTPRNFCMDPSGNFLLVANQKSDEIVIFKRNKLKGTLSPLSKRIEVGAPVCLKFD